MANIQGLFYPLTVTTSGDVQIAGTDTEDLIQSYARYLLDTECQFDVFEPVGSDVTAEQLERFIFAMRTKSPAINFEFRSRYEGRTLLIEIGWREVGTGTNSTTVEVAFSG